MLLYLLNSCPAFLYAAIGDAATLPEQAVAAGEAAEATPAAALVGLVVLGLMVAMIWAWGWVIARTVAGRPLLSPAERQPLQPWGLVDLFVAFAAFGVCMVLFSLAVKLAGAGGLFQGEETPLPLMAVAQLPTLLAVVLAAGWLAVAFRGGGWAWSTRHLRRDLLLGGMAYLLSAPLILSLNLAAMKLSGIDYDHPVQSGIDGSLLNIASGFWMAVVGAPLFEEFVFRVLLQGFLQSLAAGGPLLVSVALLGRGRLKAGSEDPADLPADRDRVDAVASGAELAGHEAATDPRRPRWPILVSGILFGLAHWGYGVSWVPLIPFGWVLGWLYYRTGRIWPCVATHAFSNAVAVSIMSVSAASGQPPA